MDKLICSSYWNDNPFDPEMVLRESGKISSKLNAHHNLQNSYVIGKQSADQYKS